MRRIDVARDEIQLLEMGERIKQLRLDSGLKQQYIADKCGVQLRTFQFWQQGKHPPEQDSLEKLAELFGVTTKYILRGDTPEPLESRGDQLDRIEAKLDEIAALLRRAEPGEADRIAEGVPAPPPSLLPPRKSRKPNAADRGRRQNGPAA